ncbi:MAG: class I SAM-dependent methyltransferase [Candidatus Hydrogenedentes bacterium]|nr:class I SAM-dependent methyltransferase [Candidatus Hydrogenedentota bacterium]
MAMNRDVRDYYQANPLMVSSPFGGVDGIQDTLLLEVFAALGIDVAGRAILDVGCGRGYAAEAVEAHGAAYTGVDLVASRTGFRLALAEAGALPFPDNAFDGLLCIDAFEHVPDGARAAAEFRRVLRPGGFVFLSVPNYGNVAGLVKWICEACGLYHKHTWAPFRNWQPQELELPLTARRVRRTFRGAGFSNLHRIGHGPEVGAGLFPWIEHAKMPEAIKFRLQRLFAAVGPRVVRVWPGASLHMFWRIDT